MIFPLLTYQLEIDYYIECPEYIRVQLMYTRTYYACFIREYLLSTQMQFSGQGQILHQSMDITAAMGITCKYKKIFHSVLATMSCKMISVFRLTSLPSIDNQDLMVNIPQDVGQSPLHYLALWSRSSLVSTILASWLTTISISNHERRWLLPV